ncbi:MAG: hypothetical protein HY921_04775 [Elusimicrobia bacterium]|nr:hypothetical protein [Elusimicrobiota bacterium]
MNSSKGQLPWALAAAASLFYLCFHSTFYNFDGVACAIAVELSDFPHLVHGNHLAYGLAGWLFHQLWKLLGYRGPALFCLQVLDSLLGGAGIGLFCSLLLAQGFTYPLAVLGALGLGFSQAYWLWSLEAQVYLFGVFFLLAALRELWSQSPRPRAAALAHGMAILGHAGHAMFFPAAATLLRKKKLRTYTAVLLITAVGAYAFCALSLLRHQSLHAWRLWILGSAALQPDRSFSWHGGYSWDNLQEWARMTLNIFADSRELEGAPQITALLLSISALAAAGLGLPSIRGAAGPRRRLAIFCLAWLISYAALFVGWEPYTIVYRIADLIPLWVLALIGLERLPPRLQGSVLAAWVAAAGLFNWRFSIKPNCDPERNWEYQEALWVRRQTPEEAWLVATARAQVYYPYFAHRRPLNMRYYSSDRKALTEKLDGLAGQGFPVYITSSVLKSADWEGFFRDYGLEEVAKRDASHLYKINRRKGIPRAGAKRG